MAERFGVSLRTIYRDIRTLEEAGVPIAGEAGAGYSIADGYRLPPVMFGREEALSFIAAEKLMQHFTDTALQNHFEAAMYKVKAVLRTTDRDTVSNLERIIDVSNRHKPFNDTIPDALQIVFNAIAEKRCIALNYLAFDADNPTKRTIEPIGIFHENNYWYIMAWCRLRADYRQFRTDRIQGITLNSDTFDKKHENMATLRSRSQQENTGTPTKILIRKSVAKYVQSSKVYFGFKEERDLGDWIEMTFLVSDCDQEFPRWLISYGDHCKVIGPESLRARVNELFEEIQHVLLSPAASLNQ
jgi:predicted DNA-binding transcriptional regulator YafY